MIGKIVSKGLIILAAILFLGGCGGSDSGSAGSGTLSVTLVDASPPGFSAIYVTVAQVDVHPADGDGWMTALTPGITVNLLDLVNGVQEQLGATELEAGPYTQLRLILGESPDDGLNLLGDPHPFANYFIDDQDPANVQELKVPSGLQTGIKLVGGFNIASGGTTNLVLDFNAAKSVVMAGASGKALLKPVIKVVAGALEVNGTVTDDSQPPLPLEGVLVSAQTTDPVAADEANQVIVVASTLTDAAGGYTLFLNPGTYNLVAYRGAEEIASVLSAFGPDCAPVDLTVVQFLSQDFSLAATTLLGEVAGAVTITGAQPDQHAVLSFRQLPGTCGENIEVASLNVVDGGTYNSVFLPEGGYRLVGATEGKPTQAVDLNVTYNSVVVGDLNFP